jgi:hypothetical protein
MTKYSVIQHTYYNNKNGVMDYTMSFGLKDKIVSNTRLYFYRYNLYDVVEIEYKDDTIFIYSCLKDRDMNFILDNLEFYAGYFKSAGLIDKRFLFDISLKLPVSYLDFVEMSYLPNAVDDAFLFVLDRKGEYVTGKNNAFLFMSTTTRTNNIDKCIFSLFNDSINIADPRVLELAGTMGSTVISGLLSGLGINGIKTEIEECDADYKFVRNLVGFEISSSNLVKIKSKLKLTKFDAIIKGLKKLDSAVNNAIDGDIVPPEKAQANLRDLLETGVDRFIKMFDNQNISWKIIIDVPMMQNMIRSAYIWKGILYINPLSINADVKYFREFLDSDNVELVMN